MESPNEGGFLFAYGLPRSVWALTGFLASGFVLSLAINLYGYWLIFWRGRERRLHRATSVRLLLLPMGSEIAKCSGLLAGIGVVTAFRDDPVVQDVGCQAYGFLVMLGFSLSSLSLFNIAIDRYMVVRGRTYTVKSLGLSTAAVGMTSVLLALGHFYTGHRASRDPGDLFLNSLSVVLIGGGLNAVAYCQWVVWSAHRAAKRGVASAQNALTANSKASKMSKDIAAAKEQQQLFWRFFGLTVVATLGWAPYLLAIVVQFASGTTASFEFDAFASTLAVYSAIPLAVLNLRFTPLLSGEVDLHLNQVGGSLLPSRNSLPSKSGSLAQF